MTKLLPITLLCTLIALIQARDTSPRNEGAFLIFSRTLSGPLVDGLNVSVKYSVHNVGSVPALRVQLRDASFPASRFDSGGTLRHTWSAVKPGESEGLEVKLAPKRAGTLYVSAPAVSYRDGGATRVSRLASADAMTVEDAVKYARRTASHKKEWAVYGVAFLVLALAPSLLYMSWKPAPDATVQVKKHH